MIVIKTQREPSTRLLLELIRQIRSEKLMEHLTYLKELSEPLSKIKVTKK